CVRIRSESTSAFGQPRLTRPTVGMEGETVMKTRRAYKAGAAAPEIGLELRLSSGKERLGQRHLIGLRGWSICHVKAALAQSSSSSWHAVSHEFDLPGK